MTNTLSINAQATTQSHQEQHSLKLRSNFDNTLAGHAAAPYDFESFVNFLSRSHCIETLDFLSEVNAYSNSYYTSEASIGQEQMRSVTRRLGKQWKSMMNTYIFSGSPSELNIPESIRTELLSNQDVMNTPPRPIVLNSTVHHARELLADGAFVSFVNSIHLTKNQPTPSRPFSSGSLYRPISPEIVSEANPLSNKNSQWVYIIPHTENLDLEKLTFDNFQGRVTIPSVISRIQLSKFLMSQTFNANSVHMDQEAFELGGEYPMQKSSVIFGTSQPVSAMNVQRVDAMSGRYPVINFWFVMYLFKLESWNCLLHILSLNWWFPQDNRRKATNGPCTYWAFPHGEQVVVSDPSSGYG